MRYIALRSYRTGAYKYVFLIAISAMVLIFVLSRQRQSLALVSTLCVSVAFTGVLARHGKLKLLFRSARTHGQDLALARTMAAASRQPFFFCCPVYASGGELTDLCVKFVNGAACRAVASSRRAMRGSSMGVLLTPESRAALMQKAAEVLKQPHAEDISLVLLRKGDGAEQYDVRLMRLAEGLAITTLHSREERMSERRAEAADQFSQSVFENAPVSIIATDIHGTILNMNSAAEQLTLYRGYDLIGVHSILALHDAAEVSLRAVELSATKDETVAAGFESLLLCASEGAGTRHEWTYVRRDGTRTWVSLTLSPLRGPAGNLTGYLAIAFDVAERKRLSDAALHMARHDQLTGLPNRISLEETIGETMQRAHSLQKGMAVYVVDIDYFKRINDSIGHMGGDAVLVTVCGPTARVSAIFRQGRPHGRR